MSRAWLVACAIALPQIAAADGVGVIAAPAERAALVQAIGERGRVVPDAIAEARAAIGAGAVPADQMLRFRRVRETIDEGWAAYLRVAIDFAASRLAAARTEAETIAALPGGAELYADASLRLGAVLGHLGRDAESHAALALALALDPDRPVTLAEFSPDVVEAVDAVRALPVVMQRTHLAVTPVDALVSVDGKEVGRGPLELDLPRGQHLIVARAPLHQPLARAVAIAEDASTFRIELERDDDSSALAAGPGLGDARALVEAVLRFAELDEVVLAVAADRRGAPALLVQRCAGLPATCTAATEIGYGDPSGLAAAARAAWQAATTAELRYPPTVFGERGGTREVHRPVWKNPYLWGGVAIAALAGTIAIIAITSGSPPAPSVTIDPGKFTH